MMKNRPMSFKKYQKEVPRLIPFLSKNVFPHASHVTAVLSRVVSKLFPHVVQITLSSFMPYLPNKKTNSKEILFVGHYPIHSVFFSLIIQQCIKIEKG